MNEFEYIDFKMLNYIKRQKIVTESLIQKKFKNTALLRFYNLKEAGLIEAHSFTKDELGALTPAGDYEISAAGMLVLENYKLIKRINIYNILIQTLISSVAAVIVSIITTCIIN